MAQTIYCVQADIADVLSQAGVDLRQDDCPSLSAARTTTTGNFTLPAVNSTGTLPVVDASWITAGFPIYLFGGGFLFVQSISGNNLTVLTADGSLTTGRSNAISSGAGVAALPIMLAAQWASARVDQYCHQRYGIKLADSLWVMERCAELAAYRLCVRRGNPVPGGVLALYEEAMSDLKAVMRGSLRIPSLPESKSSVPVMSKVRPTLLPYPRLVVETSLGTGTPENYQQNRDPWDAFGFNSSWFMQWVF